MSLFDGLAATAASETFRVFGRAATYTPPGGGTPVACTAVLDLREEGARAEDGRPPAGQVTIEVRKSEVAAPAVGGTFAIDGRSYEVQSRPLPRDAGGLVWTMWALR